MKNNIKDRSHQELVEIYNKFCPDDKLKKSTAAKKSHAELMKMVLKVVPKTKKERKGVTIRDMSLQLLCLVDYYEDKSKDPAPDNRTDPTNKSARSVGLPYREVIKRISDAFPSCVTSVACLRWYAAQVHAEAEGYEGYKLAQRRPRK